MTTENEDILKERFINYFNATYGPGTWERNQYVELTTWRRS